MIDARWNSSNSELLNVLFSGEIHTFLLTSFSGLGVNMEIAIDFNIDIIKKEVENLKRC